MSSVPIPFDISRIGSTKDLVRLVEDVKKTRTPRALTKDDETLAVLVPAGEEDTFTKLSENKAEEIPNEYFRKTLQKARENRKQGKGSPIFTDEEELIKKDPQRYQHIDTMLDWLHRQGV